MSSPHSWNPRDVQFPQTSRRVQEEFALRSIASVTTQGDTNNTYDEDLHDERDTLLDIGIMSQRMISSVRVFAAPTTEEFKQSLQHGESNPCPIESKKSNMSNKSKLSKIDRNYERTPTILSKNDRNYERTLELTNQDYETSNTGLEQNRSGLIAQLTFQSTDQHSTVDAATLGDRWCISVAQAALTIESNHSEIFKICTATFG